MSILRWHALSGYSLELTQFTGGGGNDEQRGRCWPLSQTPPRSAAARNPVAAVVRYEGQVEGAHARRRLFVAGAAIVAVALNALGGIEFSPPLPEDKQRAIELAQASRGTR